MNYVLLLLQSLLFLPILVVANRAAAPMLVVAVIAAALRYRPIGKRAVLPPLVVLLGFGALSALWSVDPANTLAKVGQLALVAVAVFVLAGAAERFSDPDRDRFARLCLIGWGLGAALPLLDFVAHDAIISGLRAVVPALRRLDAGSLIEKAGVTVIVVTMFPVLAALKHLRAPIYIYPLVVVVGLACAFAASGDAAALLPVVGGVAWLAHARWPHVVRALLCFGVPTAVLAMPLLPMLTDPVTMMTEIPHFGTSWFHRMMIWDFALDNISQRPWLGWGLDAARVLPGGDAQFHVDFSVPWREAPFVLIGGLMPLHPHNGPLQLWLEMGGVGALLAAVCLWRMLSTAIQPRSCDAPLAALFAAVAVPMLVSFGVFQSWWLALVVLAWAATRALSPAPAAGGQ